VEPQMGGCRAQLSHSHECAGQETYRTRLMMQTCSRTGEAENWRIVVGIVI
jgi:hypothetical protein